jgi:murein DD-endopeptidase MepM/ murein hydrolase activator NlpD
MSYAFNQVASGSLSRARLAADDQIFDGGFGERVPPSEGPIPQRGNGYADGRFSASGEFRRNRDGTPRPHLGTDYIGLTGDPIRSAVDGVVVHTGRIVDFGLTIVIRTSGLGEMTEFTLYAHLDEIFVRRDAQVYAGQVIGAMGYTGNATSVTPHLHFEVSHGAWGRGAARVDPETWLGRRP